LACLEALDYTGEHYGFCLCLLGYFKFTGVESDFIYGETLFLALFIGYYFISAAVAVFIEGWMDGYLDLTTLFTLLGWEVFIDGLGLRIALKAWLG
jgi:hypothetical protein